MSGGGYTTPSDLCEHVNTVTQIEKRAQDWYNSALDGYHHYRPVFIYDVTVCTDCGAVISEVKHIEFEAVDEEEHTFVNGVCSKCGDVYCPHENARWFYYGWVDGTIIVESVDATYHVLSGTRERQFECPDCGSIIKNAEEVVVTGVKEKHWVYSGICIECGYVIECEHTNTKNIYSESDWTGSLDNPSISPTITYVDEKQHRVEGYRYWSIECQDCGLTIGYGHDEILASELYAHTFVNGVCSECGYEAPVSTATPVPSPTTDPTNAPTVEPTAAPTVVPTADPTETPTVEPTAAPTVVPTADPTETPTVEPTVAPTTGSTAVSTAAPTIVPTVKPVTTVDPVEEPAQEVTAVEQVLQVVEKVQAEGSNVIIEVVGVEEVLTKEEVQALSACSVSEQLVITLASIGLDNMITAAQTSLGITLSQNAADLIEQVSSRQAALSEEEKAAVKEKLAELFPVQEVEMDGVIRECYIIDLRIVVDGVERIESFAFCLDEEGQWIFVKIM